jgi:hypothetical protein
MTTDFSSSHSGAQANLLNKVTVVDWDAINAHRAWRVHRNRQIAQ